MLPRIKESDTSKLLADKQVLENADIADGNADSTKTGDKRPDGWKPRIIPTDEVVVDYDNDPYSD